MHNVLNDFELWLDGATDLHVAVVERLKSMSPPFLGCY